MCGLLQDAAELDEAIGDVLQHRAKLGGDGRGDLDSDFLDAWREQARVRRLGGGERHYEEGDQPTSTARKRWHAYASDRGQIPSP